MAKRTDPHRPGFIVPAHYSYVMSYALPSYSSGHPIPGFRRNCEVEFFNEKTRVRGEHHPSGACCVEAFRKSHKMAIQGAPGKCSICGAQYIHGDIWRHDETGEHIHVGHNCADKYSMITDRSEYELEHDRFRAAQAVQILKLVKLEKRAAFLAKHPGLEEALNVEHYIIADIKQKFVQYTELSPKQVALVLKLAAEKTKPKVVIEEIHIDAPVGKRVEFKGTIVGQKWVEGPWGNSIKITIKVQTQVGSWLCFGTMPHDLSEALHKSGRETRGVAVHMRATLQPGKDPHFVFMKRPTFLAAI